jgi:hypothetical protein
MMPKYIWMSAGFIRMGALWIRVKSKTDVKENVTCSANFVSTMRESLACSKYFEHSVPCCPKYTAGCVCVCCLQSMPGAAAAAEEGRVGEYLAQQFSEQTAMAQQLQQQDQKKDKQQQQQEQQTAIESSRSGSRDAKS